MPYSPSLPHHCSISPLFSSTAVFLLTPPTAFSLHPSLTPISFFPSSSFSLSFLFSPSYLFLTSYSLSPRSTPLFLYAVAPSLPSPLLSLPLGLLLPISRLRVDGADSAMNYLPAHNDRTLLAKKNSNNSFQQPNCTPLRKLKALTRNIYIEKERWRIEHLICE